MRSIALFLMATVFFASCSSTKKSTTSKNSPGSDVTATNAVQDGSSFEKAILIKKRTERAGIDDEYKWLSDNYPGYTRISQSLSRNGNKHYDIIRIKTKDGEEKDIYFDITRFFGKW